jgi:hypothetical protein
MKCWRHSVSVCCGKSATRVFLLDGKMIQYCDDCAECMTATWNRWKKAEKVVPLLEWEELPKEALALMEVQES